MNRLENNECLKCGTPLVRMDGIPVCSVCEKDLREKYWQQRKKDGKPFKHVKKIRFNVMGKKGMPLKQVQRVLNQ